MWCPARRDRFECRTDIHQFRGGTQHVPPRRNGGYHLVRHGHESPKLPALQGGQDEPGHAGWRHPGLVHECGDPNISGLRVPSHRLGKPRETVEERHVLTEQGGRFQAGQSVGDGVRRVGRTVHDLHPVAVGGPVRYQPLRVVGHSTRVLGIAGRDDRHLRLHGRHRRSVDNTPLRCSV